MDASARQARGKSNRTFLFGAAGFVAISVLTAYFHFRQKIELAPVVELEQSSPTDLISELKSTPAEQDSYRRLVNWAKSSFESLVPADGAPQEKYPRATSLQITQLRQILDAGPLRRSPKQPDSFQQELAPFARAGYALSSAAISAARDGDSAVATDVVILNLRFADGVREARGTQLAYIVMVALDSTAVSSAIECARTGHIATADLLRILKAVPVEDGQDVVLADDWRIDYVQETLPMLSDISRVRDEISSVDDTVGYETSAPETPGSYSARDTALVAGQIYEIGLKNALNTWPDQDDSAVQLAIAARRSLPLQGMTPAEGTFNRWLYKLQMNASSNSIGDQLISSGLGLTNVRRTSVFMATRHEMLRAILALRIYDQEHNALPRTLDELKLAQPPMDWFAAKPLQYNPRQGYVYSIGPDRVNDSARIRGDGWTLQKNYALFLNPPPTSRQTHAAAPRAVLPQKPGQTLLGGVTFPRPLKPPPFKPQPGGVYRQPKNPDS